MAHRIPIQFKGDGSGAGKLSWGQRSMWQAMLIAGTSLPLGGVQPVEEGTTAEEIAIVLAFIMSRHQSLRTRIPRYEAGEPHQVVSESGEAALEVFDAAEEDDPADVAESVRARYERAPFDHATEWPVRMAVVRHRGVPTHVVAMYSHIVFDVYGFEALMADLANLDRATGQHLAPVGGAQPLEQVRMQHGEAARRRSAAALRQWERHLRSIPARRFPDSGDKRKPRYWALTYNSPAAYLATRHVSDRTGLHTGPILLAAYAVALARQSGINPSVIRALVSNRFRPGFAASVSPLSQSALCVVDTADATFDEVVVRAWKSLLDAGKNAYYDPVELWALIDQINRERGEEIQLECYYNDRRGSKAQISSGPAPTAREIRDALALSRLQWKSKRDETDAMCFLHMNVVAEALDYTLRGDTHYVSPAGLEAMARDLEMAIVNAALKPALPKLGAPASGYTGR